MLILCTALLASCNSTTRTKDVGGNVKTRIPMPVAGGSYELQVVELLGLNYLWELSGEYATFYQTPTVVNGHLEGSAPRTRFIKSQDLYIAADTVSLQLATVYAHTQKFAALDAELGVGSVNKWPRDIGVSVQMTGGIRNNAFYDDDTDSMLFVPYTDQNLPLAVNAGVLAHEHFHSLFFKLVTLPLNEAAVKVGAKSQQGSNSTHSQDDIYQLFGIPKNKKLEEDTVITEPVAYRIVLMRGLNEGLADFWGWLYTGDTDFIAYSLPEHRDSRSLKTVDPRQRLSLFNTPTLRGRVSALTMSPKNVTANLNNYAYVLGVQYSRILKIVTEAIAESRQLPIVDARKEMAKLILKTLSDLKTDMLNLDQNAYYDPSTFMTSLLENIEKPTDAECEIIAELMNFNENRSKYSCEEVDSGWKLVKRAINFEDEVQEALTLGGVVAPDVRFE